MICTLEPSKKKHSIKKALISVENCLCLLLGAFCLIAPYDRDPFIGLFFSPHNWINPPTNQGPFFHCSIAPFFVVLSQGSATPNGVLAAKLGWRCWRRQKTTHLTCGAGPWEGNEGRNHLSTIYDDGNTCVFILCFWCECQVAFVMIRPCWLKGGCGGQGEVFTIQIRNCTQCWFLLSSCSSCWFPGAQGYAQWIAPIGQKEIRGSFHASYYWCRVVSCLGRAPLIVRFELHTWVATLQP